MIYILGGYPRGGTSMMMSALNAGGLEAVYSQKQSDNLNEHWKEIHGDEYSPICYYERGWDITQNKNDLNDRVVKLFFGSCWAEFRRLKDLDFHILHLVRNKDDIEKSAKKLGIKGLPVDQNAIEWHKKNIEWLYELDNVKISEITYEEIIQDPLKSMIKIQNFGFPINPEKAAQDIESGTTISFKNN